jgi:hypothetical protein
MHFAVESAKKLGKLPMPITPLSQSKPAHSLQAYRQHEQTQKTSEPFNVKYKPSEFESVPKKIHLIWVASQPAETQAKYVKDWAKQNPDFKVNLWVDSQQFNAYNDNKVVRDKIQKIFPDRTAYQQEKELRGMFHQLKMSKQNSQHPLQPETLSSESQQSIQEINKTLNKTEFKHWKEHLLGNSDKIDRKNVDSVLASFERLTCHNNEKFFQADAITLDHTVKEWGSKPRDTEVFDKVKEQFKDYNNIQIKDLSRSEDIQLRNKDAYKHAIVGRNGAYPEASDIARYEILNSHGGIYVDADLECTKPLNVSKIKCHPDLMLIGLPAAKREAAGNPTPYVSNALLASHSNSNMLNNMIDSIGKTFNEMNGNTFEGSRYFGRPNKSTLESTGPNALRNQVAHTLGEPRTDLSSMTQRVWDNRATENQNFWKAMDSHFTFPAGFVNFETPEQEDSATKAMA